MKLFAKIKNTKESSGAIVLNFFSDKFVPNEKRLQIKDGYIWIEFDMPQNRIPLNLIKAMSNGEIVELYYGNPFEDNSENGNSEEMAESGNEEDPANGNSEEMAEDGNEEDPANGNSEEMTEDGNEEDPANGNSEEMSEDGNEEDLANGNSEEMTEDRIEEDPANGNSEEMTEDGNEEDPVKGNSEEMTEDRTEEDPVNGNSEEMTEDRTEEDPANGNSEEMSEDGNEEDPANGNSEEMTEDRTEEDSANGNSEKMTEDRTEEDPVNGNSEEMSEDGNEEDSANGNSEEMTEDGNEKEPNNPKNPNDDVCLILTTVLKNIAEKSLNFDTFITNVIQFFEMEKYSQFIINAIKATIEYSKSDMQKKGKWSSIKKIIEQLSGVEPKPYDEFCIRDKVREKVIDNPTAKDFIMQVTSFETYTFDKNECSGLCCFPTIPKFDKKLSKINRTEPLENQIVYILNAMGIKNFPKRQQEQAKEFIIEKVLSGMDKNTNSCKDSITDDFYARGVTENIINSFLKENNVEKIVQTETFMEALIKFLS